MPNWKKVITSGSKAQLNQITASSIRVTGKSIFGTTGHAQASHHFRGVSGDSNFFLIFDKDGEEVMKGSGAAADNNLKYQFGDNAGAGNSTFFEVDDANSRIFIQGQGGLIVDANNSNTFGVRVDGSLSASKKIYSDDEIHLRDGKSTGDTLVKMYASSDDGIIDVYQNNVVKNRINGNGDSYFTGGDVGIGDTTPDAKLDVAGNLIVDSHITASANISASGNVQVNQITASAFQFIGSGTAELEVDGHITASGNISSSASSTGSLGILELVGGVIDLKNAGAQSQIKMYCESSNAHFQTIKSAPHSEAASNTLTLPSVGTIFSTTDGTQTLTNKTLTSPDINTPDIDGGTIDGTFIGDTTPVRSNFTSVTASLSISGSAISTASFGNLRVGGYNYLGDPNTIAELDESTDATDDKIILWDENASEWKHMTLDNLQDSIDTTGGGGGGGISFDGSVANGVLTFKDSDEATTEANLTFDGTDLTIDGGLSLSGTGSLQFNLFDTGSNPMGEAYSIASRAQGDIVKFGQNYTGGSTTAGDVYFLLSSGLWRAAGASGVGLGSDELLAIALGANPAVDGMLLRGLVRVSQNLGTTGAAVYLDPSVPGHMTQTAPTGNNQIVRIIGYCTDSGTNQMYFNPSAAFVKITA